VSRPSLSAGLAAAFAALAVLVATGALTGIDQWAVDHLMPGLPGGAQHESTLTEAVVPLLHSSWSPALDVVGNVVTLPAQVVVSSVLAAVCCLLLWRRDRRRAAISWGVAWIVGNAVEVLTKSTLDRPLLHAGDVALLLAAIVTALWPAARRWVFLWAAATLALLELDGFHVPSDIAGGLLLAVLLILFARDASRRPAA
jgi:hypothetical protein